MIGEIVALISICISIYAIYLTKYQNRITESSSSAAVIASLQELVLEIDYSGGERTLVCLPDLSSYDEYEEKVSPDNRETLEKFLVFLNHAAHLVEDDLVPRQLIWNRYFHAYRFFAKKMLPWWIIEKQKLYPMCFGALHRMSQIITSIPEHKITEFDQAREEHLEFLKDIARKGDYS